MIKYDKFKFKKPNKKKKKSRYLIIKFELKKY